LLGNPHNPHWLVLGILDSYLLGNPHWLVLGILHSYLLGNPHWLVLGILHSYLLGIPPWQHTTALTTDMYLNCSCNDDDLFLTKA